MLARDASPSVDVVVVGAGLGGLYALHTLRERGFRVQVFEAADGVGGTWFWNCYPGARCDVQSLVYCYTFDEQLHREWSWSERYATQPEILRYVNFIADRLDLRRDITFGSLIVQAIFDETSNHWTLATERGEVVSARHVITATGALSVSQLPDIAGGDIFEGECYHTGEWPRGGLDFSGKRVGIVGTGSSAVQAIPLIAKEASHLTVFQRTPAFVAPARNTQTTAAEMERWRSNFAEYRARLVNGDLTGTGDLIVSEHLPPQKPRALEVPPEERHALLEARWQVGGMAVRHAFADTMSDIGANDVLADFFRAKIREIVEDSRTADLLIPSDYPFGSKRVCVGTDYYEAFNRENVTLVDVRPAPIEALTPTGLRTSKREYDLDVIIFATGFDALTGALTRIDIWGRGGRLLRDTWAENGPQSYLGVAVAGFPNLFTVNGPGSPGILGNVVVGIEQHVDWITDLLIHAQEHGFECIEADAGAQHEWFEHVNEAASETLYIKGKNWWTKDGPRGKPRVFVPYVRGIGPYRKICDHVAADDYRGFQFTSESRPLTSGSSPTAKLKQRAARR